MTIRAHGIDRTSWLRRLPVACALVTSLLVLGVSTERNASAQIAGMPKELEHVGVREHLDQPLPLDTAFRDHTGKQVRLGDYFDGKRPVVLTFAYHTCPVLCGMILNNEAEGLKGTPWTVGDKFQAVTISINPDDTLERTQAKRKSIIAQYGRSVNDDAWPFLLGDAKSIAAVAAAAGFEYEYDERQQQWGHPSVVMVLTPDGKMARYLYGLEFNPTDVKIALLEASKGRSISTVEQIILYCYHYDPQGGKYVIVAMRVMQVGGGAVAVVLGTVLALFWGRELRKNRKKRGAHPSSPAETAA